MTAEGTATGASDGNPNKTRLPESGSAMMTREDFGSDRLGAFGRYWFDLAETAGGIPPRAGFDPVALVDLLPNLVVVEHLGGDDFQYRLIGTGVDRFTKRAYTGRRTSEIDGHGPGGRLHALYTTALTAPAPVGTIMPYAGQSTICRSVRHVAAPFQTGDIPDQVIVFVEFDLVVGVDVNKLSRAERSLF